MLLLLNYFLQFLLVAFMVARVLRLEMYTMVVVDIEWIPSTYVNLVPLPFKHTLEEI
jgi:hypothetical protein